MNNQENYTYTPQELSLNRDQNISVDIYNKQNQMQTNQGIDSNYAVYNPDYVPDEIKGWHWGAFFLELGLVSTCKYNTCNYNVLCQYIHRGDINDCTCFLFRYKRK